MTPQELAELRANQIAEYMHKQEGIPEVKCFDIILILAIAGFILQLITFLRRKHHDNWGIALDDIQKPGIIQRWILRRQIKQYPALRQYPDLHYSILRGLFQVASKTSKDEIKAMSQES